MKPWYDSRTVWSLVVAGISSFLMLMGVPETAANEMAVGILDSIIPLVGIIASVFGYFGRKRATEPLKGPLE